MIQSVHFTDCLPVGPVCWACLNPVWRWRLLRAVQSSSKLLLACRHLKSITLPNPLSEEHGYQRLHAGASLFSVRARWDVRWKRFFKFQYLQEGKGGDKTGRSHGVVVGREGGISCSLCTQKSDHHSYITHPLTDAPRRTSTCVAYADRTRQLLPKSRRVWTAAEQVGDGGCWIGGAGNGERFLRYRLLVTFGSCLKRLKATALTAILSQFSTCKTACIQKRLHLFVLAEPFVV